MSTISETKIHPLASVSSTAKIGNGVKIHPFAVIEDDVEIDDGAIIDPHAVLLSGVRIGKDCHIHSGAVLGAKPQDLKFRGEKTYVFIGDRSVIRECVTINVGTKASGQTIIGSDCLLMAYVHVGHDCIIGNHVIIANTVQFGGHCEVGDYVVIGGMTGLHQFVRVGRHVMLGAMTKNVHDIPPYVTTSHDRYEGVNVIGLKRRGYSSETISHIRDVYRVIFQSGLLIKNAVEKVKAEFPKTPEVEEILAFFEAESKRKYIRPYMVGKA
ncbi:acyl-(acyl-carrier-protein)--UDP-N-acetylglucosamine O-acyltransferase [Chloroherpeton thalassium ATCC 35110]|uniref:Acyl-(Acyl-carrier-protein)--UDP-N-acetylglucosamine O-acyltransferase n=1 Tax=Chloroherpeton thalassium (strain ATCC 35110 / GB-78) TaxID=517418 RepID=B3QWD1_CHLT3|nr:acyl-ACP--UDP-N-acetylglucosamine O-acyltransferase [Chloroherpeton thalassium]ACF13244.1 acyl-(acyl-carrier-protein)--UDP-N-acetylglucosamine O-acyltransferase [Chloroherpeton thalassium ATCC 35110]